VIGRTSNFCLRGETMSATVRRATRQYLVTLFALALLSVPRVATSQQAQLDLHGDLVVGTSTHNKSWGGGVGAQIALNSSSSPVVVSVSPSVDYVKQQNDGPSQTSLSADVDVQPGGSSTVTPYAGVSAGANWSGGSNKQWTGSELGLEMLAGAQVKLGGSKVTAKAEERFGYVKDQEHTLTTRLGVLLSF